MVKSVQSILPWFIKSPQSLLIFILNFQAKKKDDDGFMGARRGLNKTEENVCDIVRTTQP